MKEFSELRKIHLEKFSYGLKLAGFDPEWNSATSEQRRIIVANKVCDLARRQSGTYGSTRDIRIALTDYVIKLAMAAGV